MTTKNPPGPESGDCPYCDDGYVHYPGDASSGDWRDLYATESWEPCEYCSKSKEEDTNGR